MIPRFVNWDIRLGSNVSTRWCNGQRAAVRPSNIRRRDHHRYGRAERAGGCGGASRGEVDMSSLRVRKYKSVRRHVVASSLGSRGAIPHRVQRFEENKLCGAVAEGGHVVIVSRFGAHGQRRGTASKKLGAGVRV